ncbi:MAG: hypothetical protein JXP73_10765 [Deltaproteobacteria bacterium]|nr:hypothetical protein [Deltaproteobacteria bacterium]
MASPRARESNRLFAHMTGEGPPLVITGTPGAGKSALCSKLARALGKEPRICVSRSVERSMRSGYDELFVEDLEKSVKRLLEAKGISYRVLRSNREKGGVALPFFDVDGDRLFVILDGLDYLLSSQELDASFLPLEIPRGMRLAVSLSRGPLLDALAARGWHVHEVEPLAPDERRRLIEFGLSDPEAKRELVEGLLDWPHAGHPASLELAMALAKITGTAPTPADDVAAVVGRLFALRPPPSDIAALLAVAEYGVPDYPILAMRSRFGACASIPGIVRRRGFYVPAVPEVREALRGRVTDEQLRAAHLAVFAAYCDECGPGLFQEAAQHLMAANAHERLARFLTEVVPFQHLINGNVGFLERCWQTMPFSDGAERYQRMLDAALPTAERELRVALLNNVGLLASGLGWNEMAGRLLRRALDEAKRAFPPTHGKVGTAMANLASYLQKQGGADAEVEALYREMLDTFEGPVPVDDEYSKKWSVLESYASFLESRDRDDEGLSRREEGVAAARAALGDHHPSVAMELLWCSRAIRWRLPGRALSEAERAREILLSAMGPLSDRMAFALRLISGAEQALGRYDRALATAERALAIGRSLAARYPYEAAYDYERLTDVAEAQDDRCTALAWRQEEYQHYRQHLGPWHATTLASGWRLGLRLEAAGQLQAALELIEGLIAGYRQRSGAEHSDTLGVQVAAVRLAWRLGRRAEAENRLGECAAAIESRASASVRGMVRLLRSEWAREDGHGEAARGLLEEALAIWQLAGEVGSSLGVLHVLLAGEYLLAGEHELSARHHEAGIGLVDDWQQHLGPQVLRPYRASAPLPADVEEIRGRGREELRVRLALSSDRARLDLGLLPDRALRAAWNPADGRTLAAVDKSGHSHLFLWHPESAQLERLDPPFAKRVLPKDLAAFTLRWSASGQALRLVTPDGEETVGVSRPGEIWAPASTLSPDGRHVVYLGNHSVSVMHARLRSPRAPSARIETWGEERDRTMSPAPA